MTGARGVDGPDGVTANCSARTTRCTLRCFGRGEQGELGSGDTNSIGEASGEMSPPEVAVH